MTVGQSKADLEVCVSPGFSLVLTQSSFAEWKGWNWAFVNPVKPFRYEGFCLWALYHDNLFSQPKRTYGKPCLSGVHKTAPLGVCILYCCLLHYIKQTASVISPAQTLLSKLIRSDLCFHCVLNVARLILNSCHILINECIKIWSCDAARRSNNMKKQVYVNICKA